MPYHAFETSKMKMFAFYNSVKEMNDIKFENPKIGTKSLSDVQNVSNIHFFCVFFINYI